MFEWMPTFVGTVTLADIAIAAFVIVVAYAIHELLHATTMKAFGIPFTAKIFPDEDSGYLRQLLFGTVVELEMDSVPPRWHVVVVSLAPLVQAAAPLVFWTYALTFPAIDIGAALILVCWFAVAFPSPADWTTAFRYAPEVARQEGATHG